MRGVPVIASDCEGMRDVVSEGINGHRVTRGDALAFAEVIDRYAHRPDELADLSGRARQHVRHTYSWPVVAEHFVGVLHGVIGAE